MRVSCEHDSPYYVEPGRYRVTLDGVLQRDVIEADDTEGWVIVLKRNEQGLLVVDRAEGRVERKWLCGHVRILDATTIKAKPAPHGILGVKP